MSIARVQGLGNEAYLNPFNATFQARVKHINCQQAAFGRSITGPRDAVSVVLKESHADIATLTDCCSARIDLPCEMGFIRQHYVNDERKNSVGLVGWHGRIRWRHVESHVNGSGQVFRGKVEVPDLPVSGGMNRPSIGG